MDNKISMRTGVPDIWFMREAWSDETLSVTLPGIDFDIAFPSPDPAMSLVAKLGDSRRSMCCTHGCQVLPTRRTSRRTRT